MLNYSATSSKSGMFDVLQAVEVLMAATICNMSPATFESLPRQHQGSNSETVLSLLQRCVSKPLVCHKECQQLQGMLGSRRPVTRTSGAYDPFRRPATDDEDDCDMDNWPG